MGWTRFLRRSRWDDERAREIQSHIDIETDENIARGMPPEEARLYARRKFGNVTMVREEIYRFNTVAFLASVWKDIRFGVRTMVRSPGATLVAVLALALGIGANTVTLTSVRSLVLYPMPFHDLDRIVRVWDSDPAHGFTQNMVSKGDFIDWRQRNRSFEHLAAFQVASDNLTGDGEPERIEGAIVSSDLFPLLGTKPLLGRTFDHSEEQPGSNVILLSHTLWERRYGADPGIVGRKIPMDGRAPWTVLGVMPREFDFPLGAEFWAPMNLAQKQRTQRRSRNLFVVGRLKDGVSIGQAESEMNAMAHELAGTYREDEGHGVRIRPIREVTNVTTGRFVLVGFAAAAFVLLLGCVNVANLQLARATARSRESAVRAALGAGRWRIARQVLVENVLLASVAGVLGAAAGAWILRLEQVAIPAQVYKWVAGLRAMNVSPAVLLQSAAAAIAAGLVCGIIPAWRAASNQRADLLKTGRGAGSAGRRGGLGNGLVIAEVALAAVLLIAAGLLFGTFRRIARLEVGFRPDHLLTMHLNVPWALRKLEPTRRFYADVLGRVRALPEVASAGATNGGGAVIDSFRIGGQPSAEPGEAPPEMQLVTPGFFEAMGLPLIRGRTFTEADAERRPRTALVVSESVARRYWKSKGDPVGAQAVIESYDFPVFTIVGIVGDTKDWFTGAPAETVYVLNDQMPQYSFELLVRTRGDPGRALAAVRAQAQSVDRTQPVYNARTMEQFFSDQLSGVRMSTWMMGIFAAIALVLAASGVYGVVSYSVARRTHEIGIRMALGAAADEVRRHIVAGAMRPVLAGIVLGTAAALGLTRLMSSVLYGVVALEPDTFAGVIALLAAAALLAGYLPARRASSVDPIVALREE